jgi:hypothetical protein
MPFIGVWMMREEATPVSLKVEGTQIIASHSGTVYQIDFSDIISASELALLPNGTRTNGTAMETVLKGNFKYDGIGPCRVCLDPRVPPFLVLTADSRTYILGSSSPAEMRIVTETLRGKGLMAAAS